jgi:hypothetical protein
VELYCQENPEELGKGPVPVPLSPPQITHHDPGANPGLRGKRPATNRLSHGSKYLITLFTLHLNLPCTRNDVLRIR